MKVRLRNRKTFLYGILLTGTLVILSGMIIVDKRVNDFDVNHIRKGLKDDSEKTAETINELLLSANELTISEKTAFINLYLKLDDLSDEGAVKAISSKRNEVYSKILNRKIGKVKASGVNNDDFFIRAVPK